MPKSERNRRLERSPLQDVLARTVGGLQAAGPPPLAAWGLGIAVLLLFGAGLGHPLVFGDFALLEAGRLAAYGTTWPAPGSPWLSDATFGAWARIAGQDWPWHRALNLAFHAMAVVFAFAVARRLLARDAGAGVHPGWAAWFAAGLFALHPVVVYPVAYLAARPLLLQGVFTLVAIWSVLRAADETWRGVWWLGPLACAGAVLASPAGVGLPLAMAAALVVTSGGPRPGPAWTAVALSAVIAVAWLAWGYAAGTAPAGDAGYLAAVGENAWRWLRGIGFGIVPVTAMIGIDMPEPEPAAAAWLGGASVAACAAVAYAAFRFSSRPGSRGLGAALAILAALSLPEILHPGAWAAFSPWRSYPWIPFLCIVLAWSVARVSPRLALGVAVAAVAGWVVLAATTLHTFSSHVRVWDQAIRVAERSGLQPQDARLFVNRATVHRSAGHALAAIADYGKALELQPDMARALRGRAQAYIDDTRYGAALRDLERLLQVEPAQAITHADIGLVHMQMGRFPEAMKAFDAALAKGAREPRVYLNRGIALFQLGGPGAAPRALDDIERAIALDGGYALAHFNRGLIFEQAAEAGVRLRDAVSPQIMRIVAARNIARACELGHRPACNLERERAEKKEKGAPAVQDMPYAITPEQLRRQGLPLQR